jgi:hypothetical protein
VIWRSLFTEDSTFPNPLHTFWRVIGWFGFDMLDADQSIIGDCAEPLRPDGMLAADTPVIEAAKAFAGDAPHIYFILNENRIDGWFRIR